MSMPKYDGTNHIFFSNQGNEVVISSKPGQNLTINCDLINTTNSAFKLNNYVGSTSQALTLAVVNRVLFGTNVLTEIPGLIKTTTSPGSVFSNTNSYPLKLNVNYSMRAGGGCSGLSGRIQLSSTVAYFGLNSGFDSSFNLPSCSSSATFTLQAGENFSVFAVANGTTSISSNTSNFASTLNIYSLN